MKRMRLATSFATISAVAVLYWGIPTALAQPVITEYPIPSGGLALTIAAGSDEGMWFTEPYNNRIGRIDPAGAIVEFSVPSPFADPIGISAGPANTVWFTEFGDGFGAQGIGEIDTSGTITEFPLPPSSFPYGIALGPDGNLWFTEAEPYRIGRITPSGTVTVFPFSTRDEPLNIVTGPDGNLWFTEDGIVNGGAGGIGRITPSGTLTEFALPTPMGFNGGASDVTAGPDGALWFTWNEQANTGVGPFTIRIGRITTSGAISSFLVATSAAPRAFGIMTGSDGNLWFTEPWANRIGRMSTSGALTEFPIPTANSFPDDIATGAAGHVWFTESGSSKIGRISFVTAVPIDIKPGSTTNPIKLSSTGRIPVAILSTSSFDATTVDPTSVCFGDAEVPAQRDCTATGSSIDDVKGDGRPDLLLRFKTNQTGIDPGDTKACLTGTTFSGLGVEGCDSIKTL